MLLLVCVVIRLKKGQLADDLYLFSVCCNTLVHTWKAWPLQERSVSAWHRLHNWHYLHCISIHLTSVWPCVCAHASYHTQLVQRTYVVHPIVANGCLCTVHDMPPWWEWCPLKVLAFLQYPQNNQIDLLSIFLFMHSKWYTLEDGSMYVCEMYGNRINFCSVHSMWMLMIPCALKSHVNLFSALLWIHLACVCARWRL